jgi:hypothetical protein
MARAFGIILRGCVIVVALYGLTIGVQIVDLSISPGQMGRNGHVPLGEPDAVSLDSG